jgi:lysophospholipase L1-like esterase
MKIYKDGIDEVVKYYNHLIEEICLDLNVKYVDLFDSFDKKEEYFSNPLDIHPNKLGYEIISKEIIKNIES